MSTLWILTIIIGLMAAYFMIGAGIAYYARKQEGKQLEVGLLLTITILWPIMGIMWFYEKWNELMEKKW